MGNPQDAEDLTAQVFENALKAIPRYRDMGKPIIVWLLSIANNLVIDHYRARRSQTSIENIIIRNDATTDPVAVAEQNFDNEKFRWAFSKLSDKDQKAIIMRFIQRLEFSEIGQILGIKAISARVRLHRAGAFLKEIMRKDEDGDTVNGRRKKGRQKWTQAQLIASVERRGDFGSGDQREKLYKIFDKHGISTRTGRKMGFYVTEEEFEEMSKELQEAIGLKR